MSKKKQPVVIDLQELAAEIARETNPTPGKAYNLGLVSTQAVLASLGRKLRKTSGAQAVAIVAAITERGGVTP